MYHPSFITVFFLIFAETKEKMARGYRIDTPIGSFVPKLHPKSAPCSRKLLNFSIGERLFEYRRTVV